MTAKDTPTIKEKRGERKMLSSLFSTFFDISLRKLIYLPLHGNTNTV